MTPELWAKAVEEGERRYALHLDSPTRQVWSEHNELMGAAGEYEFGDVFGQPVSTVLTGRRGDGGIDFRLPVTYVVDVKTRDPRGSLLVSPQELLGPAQIYALAHCDVERQDCQLQGWQWASAVRHAPIIDCGHGPRHEVTTLRTTEELLPRTVRRCKCCGGWK